jgi:DNA-binding transcriptional MerR regulator
MLDAPRDIPDKPYFKIGEVAELIGVEPYVLRYWETEFKSIRPEKTRTNQRMYRRKDVELVFTIKRLLHEEGFRIDGAKRRLRELSGEETSVEQRLLVSKVRQIADDLERIVDEDERAR